MTNSSDKSLSVLNHQLFLSKANDSYDAITAAQAHPASSGQAVGWGVGGREFLLVRGGAHLFKKGFEGLMPLF